MLTPPLRHWYPVAPVAVMVKVAVCPTLTVWEAGGTTITGTWVTVRMALALGTLPDPLETTTLNWAPLSAATAAGVV